METKEKNSLLIELCKIQMDHFEKTRNIEFKVNIALWTLIALAGKFGYGKIKLDHNSFFILLYTFFSVVIVVLHWCWMKNIQNSENSDIALRNKYRSEIHKTIELELKLESNQNDSESSWVIIETGVTAVLLVGLGIIFSL
jgi:hypothetical protein